MKLPSEEEILASLLEKAREARPDVPWAPGLPHTDLSITVPVREFERAYILLEFLYKIATPQGFLSFVKDADAMAKLGTQLNLQEGGLESFLLEIASKKFQPLEPIPAKPSYCMLKILSSSQALTISSSATITTPTNIVFRPLVFGDVTLIWDSTLGCWVGNIPLKSVNTGSYTNIPAGEISLENVTGFIGNLIGAFNPEPASGGRDDETLEQYLWRVARYWINGQVNHSQIIENIVLSSSATDAKLIYAGEKHFSRGNGVDVWVKVPEVYLEYFASSSSEVIQPEVGFVPASSELMNMYFGSVYQRTVGTFPRFVKCSPFIRELQSLIWNKKSFVLGSDDLVLVRKAYPLSLEVKVTVVVKGGLNTQPVKDSIVEKTVSFFENYKIGERFDFSDYLHYLLDNFTFIDYIRTEPQNTYFKIQNTGQIYDLSTASYIEPDFWQYIRLASINVSVVGG
ncbi:MAG: hypothetical protein QXY76_03310 [Nitrososphaeria archaeon]